jgi:acetylornithine deacetylase
MDLVPLLKALVAVDSTSARSNLPVIELLEREARAAGFDTRRPSGPTRPGSRRRT